MYGAIEFYRTAIASGVKPIVGVEAYMARGSMHRKDAKLDGRGSNYHLTLLAMNEIGYKNLLKITSKGHVEGFYYNPRIDLDCLEQHAEGVFVLSGCMGGQLSSSVLEGNREESERLARVYREIFGDRYAIEVMWHGHEKQDNLNKGLISIADQLGIPVVATCDSHYARPEDARSHDAMLAIQTGSTLDDPGRFRIQPYGAYYLQSEQEMLRGFSERPDVIRNSEWIADRCNLKLDFSKVMLPEFPIPDNHTPISWLRSQVYDGLKWRYGSINDIHKNRVDYELSIIEQTGYALYFLIVQDYVQYARKQGVMAVPRGSVAGSLCIYALGICDIDPVRYDIMFERFLHGERKGMPDVDMDFADDRRDDVIAYVTERYGKARVAHVGTFQTLGARAAVKDAARVLNVPFGVSNAFTGLFPDTLGASIAELEQDPRVRKAIDSDPLLGEVITLAKGIEGLARGFGTHAAGMLITATDLDDVVPVQLPPEKGTKKSTGTFVTQYDNNNQTAIIESLGLSKFDFLGLANLSIIRDACALIKKRHDIDLYGESGEKLYSDLPLEYEHPLARRAYDLLSAGDTEAVFQVESPGMRRVLRLVRPSRITDLPAIVALYRPGPLEYIPQFAEAKHGQRRIEYLHEDLRPILEETYGVVTYQDQVLLIARNIAGFTWGEVDVLRKGMGKKQADVIEKLRTQFIDQSVARGYDKDIVEEIWEQIAPFAGYGFNRAHAYCYGYIAFATAFLKANYPIEYMTTVLTHEAGNKDKISLSIAECRRMGLPVLPPSVNASMMNFSIANVNGEDTIVFGLSAIAGMGAGACRVLLSARSEARFQGFYDFLDRVDLGVIDQRNLTGLIHAGAFDEFGHRAQLESAMKSSLETSRDLFRLRQLGQMNLFGAETMAGMAKKLPEVPSHSRRKTLENEFKVLGVYVSEHPLDDIRDQLEYYTTKNADTIQSAEDGREIVGGIISQLRFHAQKKDGKMMAFVTLDDLVGQIDVVFFARTYDKFKHILDEEIRVLILGNISRRDDRVSLLADDIIVLKDAAPSVKSEIRPPDADWNLGKEKISDRIMDVWNAVSRERIEQQNNTSSVLNIVSEKGDILVEFSFSPHVLREIFQ
jgi:DNA polymerase-3 subunit alpha